MGVFAVGLGFGGLFFLLFSPGVAVPFWLFCALSACLTTMLGVFLGAALDVILRHDFPAFAAIGGIAGLALGVYYASSVFRVKPTR